MTIPSRRPFSLTLRLNGMRMSCDARRFPPLGRWLLAALVLVVVAFLLADPVIGARTPDSGNGLVHTALMLTDIVRLPSILSGLAVLLVLTAVAARCASARKARARLCYVTSAIAYALTTTVVTSAVTHVFKIAIGRARPPLFDSEGVAGFQPFNGQFLHESFPSAHSAHSAALFVALALAFPRLRIPFLLAGVWFGATRIIIGVHYPSDVIAGLAIGGAIAVVIAVLLSRLRLVFRLSGTGWPLSRLP